MARVSDRLTGLGGEAPGVAFSEGEIARPRRRTPAVRPKTANRFDIDQISLSARPITHGRYRAKEQCSTESSAVSNEMTFFFNCTVSVREESSQRTVVIARPMATVRRPSFTELRPSGLRAAETPHLVEAAQRSGVQRRAERAKRAARAKARAASPLQRHVRRQRTLTDEEQPRP